MSILLNGHGANPQDGQKGLHRLTSDETLLALTRMFADGNKHYMVDNLPAATYAAENYRDIIDGGYFPHTNRTLEYLAIHLKVGITVTIREIGNDQPYQNLHPYLRAAYQTLQ